MRVFAALGVPEDVQARVAALQSRLRAPQAPVLWVAPAQFHLTLKFYGDVPDDAGGALAGVIARAVAGAGPVTVRVSSVGAFPSVAAPRVLWVGASDEQRLLPRLADLIENASAAAGWAREPRPFAGHITIGRIRRAAAAGQLVDRLREHAGEEFGTFEARAVHLVRSDLRDDGPHYSWVHSISL